MQLSEYFTEEEFLRSRTAAKFNIDNSWKKQSHRENAKTVCNQYLERIRTFIAKPIVITSGYRVPELNTAIGGSSTSEHTQGTAVDFYILGLDIIEAWQDVREIVKTLSFNQLILEPSWIHLGIGGIGNQKREIWSNNPNHKILEKPSVYKPATLAITNDLTKLRDKVQVSMQEVIDKMDNVIERMKKLHCDS